VPGTLEAVGIFVWAWGRAVAFYSCVGAPFPEAAGDSEHGHAEAGLVGGVRLLLDTEEAIRSFDPAWRRADGSPGVSVAFRCESPAAVDELYSRALAAGGRGHREPWDAFWGQRYAQLRDPDGNGVDLYADLKPAG